MYLFVVAPDSFKGSLTAAEAAEAIRKGLFSGFSARGVSATVCPVPIADGGEGTLDAVVDPSDRVACEVTGPDGKRRIAFWGRYKETAVVEMASAAGLILLDESERSAGKTTTYGVGELILGALDAGYRDLILTVGGSATNDAGCGMFSALGAAFLKKDGTAFLPTGETLGEIDRILTDRLDPRLSSCRITIATDVKNPLLGENGATFVYAKQKGATPAELDAMEAGMKHLAGLYERLCGRDVAAIPGCGAGGGIATPLLAFTRAEIRSGIDAVLDAVGFDACLVGADAVITGEGKIDRQSLFGKAISGVAKRAAAKELPVYCFVGCVGDDPEELKKLGIAGIYAISELAPDPEASMREAKQYLFELARRFALSYRGKERSKT